MLITAVVAEVIGFAIYSLKASKENTKGGIIYETALLKQIQLSKNKEEESNDDNNQEVQG